MRPVDLSTTMLIVRISNETDLPEHVVQRIILRLSAEMKAALLRREPVELDGIGTISVRDVPHLLTLPDPDAEPQTVIGKNALTYRPFQSNNEAGYWRVMPRVFLETDPKLQKSAAHIAYPDGVAPAYQPRMFSQAQCEEIRARIASGNATIKGLAREIGVSKHLIRRIIRSQTVNNQPQETEDE